MASQWMRGYGALCMKGQSEIALGQCSKYFKLGWSSQPQYLLNRVSHTQSRLCTTVVSCMNSVSPRLLFLRLPIRTSLQPVRFHASNQQEKAKRKRSAVIYILATAVFMLGMTYAGVPLYRMLCQTTGLGGEVQKGHDTTKVETMKAVKDRQIRVRFNADIASSMQWNFRPHLPEIKVVPGETALAFYKAKNPTDQPIVGISTYNVVPYEAAQYFNKIQCFCFEEQRLNPHEEVDLPVFFYIDPEFNDDPRLENVQSITLSYTFFEAKEGMKLPEFNYNQHQRRLF